MVACLKAQTKEWRVHMRRNAGAAELRLDAGCEAEPEDHAGIQTVRATSDQQRTIEKHLKCFSETLVCIESLLFLPRRGQRKHQESTAKFRLTEAAR